MRLLTHNYGNYATVTRKFSMNQFCVLRNHAVNRITFDHSPHIKSPLEIHVYAYKWLKNIGIVMTLGINVYFVNLNHVTKFFYGGSIITPRFTIRPIKKIWLAIIIGLKILLPQWNSIWTCLKECESFYLILPHTSQLENQTYMNIVVIVDILLITFLKLYDN